MLSLRKLKDDPMSFFSNRRHGESGEHQNVYPINHDDVPTRPVSRDHELDSLTSFRRMHPEFDPPPSAAEVRDFRKEVTGAPPSTLPPVTVKEIDAATNILELLLEHDPEARARVTKLVDTMMELYAPPPAPAADVPPTVEGAPV